LDNEITTTAGKLPEPIGSLSGAASSAALVHQARAGDERAFLELMAESRDRLLRIALAYLRSEEAALEAIQETTCRAYMKLGKLKEPAYFQTWQVRILMNVCIDEQKRRRRQRPAVSLSERHAVESGIDDRLRMEDAIAELEPKLRQVVILKYYEDMTLTEIAKLLEKPEGTVKTWLNKALEKLRTWMREGETQDEG
jgi:RNA polymerase sigma factor (sigma-70 family)